MPCAVSHPAPKCADDEPAAQDQPAPKRAAGGRAADLRALARKQTKCMVRVLRAIAGEKDAPPAARIAAAVALLDRGWGRPPQALETTGAEGGAAETEDLNAIQQFLHDRIAAAFVRLGNGADHRRPDPGDGE